MMLRLSANSQNMCDLYEKVQKKKTLKPNIRRDDKDTVYGILSKLVILLNIYHQMIFQEKWVKVLIIPLLFG